MSAPHDDHDGADAASMARRSHRRETRLRIALGLNVAIVAVQVIFGWAAHSLGLLADAGHNLTDVVAVVLSLLAVRWARRRPTGQRSFGYHRASILAAQTNALSILAATVVISVEGIRRLLHPVRVSGGTIVVIALIATAANLLAVLALRESPDGHAHAHGGDLNMRSALLHMAGDAASSLGVALAGLVILLTKSFFWLDPAVSLVVGVLIAFHAWKLLRAATDVLLESTPTGLDLDDVVEAIQGVAGVNHAHDVHVWSLSSEIRALSAHVVLDGDPSLADAQVVARSIKQVIGPRFGIAHATLELECDACTDGGPWCAIDDITAPASLGHNH